MKSLVRYIVTKVLLYAFSPAQGRTGIRLMKFTDGGFLVSLSDSDSISVTSIKMHGGRVDITTHHDVQVNVDGSLFTNVSKSHWESVGGIKALNAEVLTQQDPQLKNYLPDVDGLDERLHDQVSRTIVNAQKLQSNMEGEQCHLHDHAPSLPVKR